MFTLQATSMPVNATGRYQSIALSTILLLLLQLVAPFLQRPPLIVQAATPPPARPPAATAESAARVAEKLNQMPMTFEQNLGQTNDHVKFTARGKGYGLFLTPTEAVMTLPQGRNKRPLALRMQLVGGNPNPVVTGLEQTGTVSNYYLGNDPAKFRTGVPHFAKVKYTQVYPGIDAVYHSQQQELEYDFLVAPGVDPRLIQMTFQGARKLSLDNNGDLVIDTAAGRVRHRKPVLYQTIAGQRQEVAGSFRLRQQRVSFSVGAYDPASELVIDPTPSLDYSTYLGGYDGDEKGYAIALDSSNNAYLTGEVASTSFPDVNIGSGGGGKDIFIAKLNATGTALNTFYTFIGGTDDEWGTGIRVDSNGNSYLCGVIGSNWTVPGTVSGYVTTDPAANNNDAFVAKLNSSGGLTNFTYLGGSNVDQANGLALDGTDVCVVGQTNSGTCTGCTAFPTSTTPYDSSHNGQSDVFVSKLNSSLGTLSYSTFIGGSNNDYGTAIAVQGGYLYLTGYTQSSGFPTNSAFDNTITGSAPIDAIVVKLDPTAGTSGLAYSTFLGGNGRDEGRGIAVNTSGEAFVTGRTHSTGQDIEDVNDPSGYPYTATSTTFPVTSEHYQKAQAGAGDAFVARLNSSGNGLVYSTLLGGGDQDTGYGIALSSNVAYIAGETDSTNFPLEPNSPAFQGNQTGTDAFFSKVDTGASGSASLAFSTYHGGGAIDSGRGIAVASSSAYIVGFTESISEAYSGTFPVEPASPYQDDVAGGFDCFAAKITP